jgi:hypothetical protein
VAEIKVDCGYTKDKKTAFCVTNNEGTEALWRCDKQRNGTWKCAEVPTSSSRIIPPKLRDALVQAGAIRRGSEQS